MTTPNLGAALIAGGYSFAGYSENLPAVGSLKRSTRGGYARKHNPWSNWQAENPGPNQLSIHTNQPFDTFPSDFGSRPSPSSCRTWTTTSMATPSLPTVR